MEFKLNEALKCEIEKTEIDLLLEAIYRVYGLEFRNYSQQFIRRRIFRRMMAERLNSISGLQEKVLHNPEVMEKLFSDLSINVTEMFRNPDFFRSLRTKVVPKLREYPFIRIWHAGCSSGEEAYSMAILLHEEGLYHKTKIYATDICDKALNKARQGIIKLEKMQEYTKNYHKAGGNCEFSEYYSVKNSEVFFSQDLKKNIIFAQHNLATDHSFNEFHVIICRNVTIYFNKTLQERVYNLFNQSLGKNGILGLGDKEVLKYSSISNSYAELDAEQRIYKKISFTE
ncbi:CheR family methyltransferase [Dendrosporobacter sp. 1207_IL3150]|uniref:CheR family methyltransferase n=1 Tax=Dendrosporobacter sp. 1207_IL3150 TaxID=3084054 RepID=UPI002FD9AB7E